MDGTACPVALVPYYSDPTVTLYCGDCRALLPAIGQVDHVITDPPYDAHTHASARSGYRDGVIDPIRIDFDPLDVAHVAPMLLGAARRWCIAFCSMEMLGQYRDVAGERWVRAGFWHRLNGAPQFTGDRPAQPGEGLAICHAPGKKRWNNGGHSAFYAYTIERSEWRAHPTQKPEALMLRLITDFTDPDDLILDPFAGAGTTLAAAKRIGRRAIGIEINPSYCDLAVERLRQGSLLF